MKHKKLIAELDKRIASCTRNVSTGDAKSDVAYREALNGLANTFKTARDQEAQKIGRKTRRQNQRGQHRVALEIDDFS